MADAVRIAVAAEHGYEIVIGRSLLSHAAAMVHGATRVAIIYPDRLSSVAHELAAALGDAGVEVHPIVVPDAEDAKTAGVLEACWGALGEGGFTRSDAIIGLGGGATTDLAGFAAATWLRGIRVLQIPTTLLGMVDAAVGGKTGINTRAGKNLVGAFHSPCGVLCDLDLLASLDRADLRAGMAEVVKVGFTSDPSILEDVTRDVDACMDPGGRILGDLVRRAVQVKADVVSGDFREVSATAGGGLGREVLNYGHTFGHAVERVEDFRWRHGEAVSVGLMYVAELAGLGGMLDADGVALHRQVLETLGLPTRYAAGRWPELLAAMQIDKKARGTLLRFVVLEGIGHPVNWNGPDPALLEAAYARISTG